VPFWSGRCRDCAVREPELDRQAQGPARDRKLAREGKCKGRHLHKTGFEFQPGSKICGYRFREKKMAGLQSEIPAESLVYESRRILVYDQSIGKAGNENFRSRKTG
jgi:hypothetical protein